MGRETKADKQHSRVTKVSLTQELSTMKELLFFNNLRGYTKDRNGVVVPSSGAPLTTTTCLLDTTSFSSPSPHSRFFRLGLPVYDRGTEKPDL